MATLQLPDNGQTLTLDDQIAQDDTLLRQALALVYPAVANAEIKREHKNGELVVSVIKRAGTKGQPLAVLATAPEEANPALLLAWELKALERAGEFDLTVSVAVQNRVQEALSQGEAETKKISRIVQTLTQLKPSPYHQVPVGF